jgi:hypothetical protein
MPLTSKNKFKGVIIMRNLVALIVFGLLLSFSFSAYAQPPDQSPQPAQDVTVINPTTNPVPITVENDDDNPVSTNSVDNPAKQPFSAEVQVDIEAGLVGGCESVITVPEGKRLVIEYYSVVLGFFADRQLGLLAIQVGPSLEHLFPIPEAYMPDGPGTSNRVYTSGYNTRIYADPGVEVSACINRYGPNMDDADGGSASLSGYFVNID